MSSSVEVVHKEPLVTRVLPDVFEPVHMKQFGAEGDPVARDQFGDRQVHGQNGVVFLHVRAEQEERGAIRRQLASRQETGVVEIHAVAIALPASYRATGYQ